eukprot:m.153410 g.153410  ORF g.153410 m.153410 type:complete len:87 (-) comp14288_c0_seq1:427-687(-)
MCTYSHQGRHTHQHHKRWCCLTSPAEVHMDKKHLHGLALTEPTPSRQLQHVLMRGTPLSVFVFFRALTKPKQSLSAWWVYNVDGVY